MFGKKVPKVGPWSFDKQILILNVIEGENPTTIPLFNIPLWIQIHILLLGFKSQGVGKSIGSIWGNSISSMTLTT